MVIKKYEKKFVDMYKEGAGFRSMLNMFAISVSMGLQFGDPLEKYVENFVFTRFEPSGFTDHPNVKSCNSIVDFIFRVLGMEYLGMTDFVQVPPKGIRRNKFENMARLAEAGAQKKMELNVETPIDPATEDIQVLEGQESLPSLKMEQVDAGTSGKDQAMSEMMGDAPACPTCGHITVRNGSCYKCLNCGDSLGCS